MLKKFFFFAILLAFSLSLAIPASAENEAGANQVDFTAKSVDYCYMGGSDPFCSGGEVVIKPSGRMFIVGFQAVILFSDSTDPRWNAKCYFTAQPFTPRDRNPLMGSFVCYPTDPAYAGGWWEGSVHQVFMTDKFVGNWSGKGFGKFDGLLVNNYNSMSSHYNDLTPGFGNNSGTIIELPGYEP